MNSSPVAAGGIRLLKEPPPAGSMILEAGGASCGVVTPAAWKWLQENSLADFFERRQDRLLLRGPHALPEPENALEEFARACAGIVPGFHPERLDVQLDGRKLFRARRGIVRILGFTTRCVHAVGRTPGGLYAASLRSSSRKVNPGKWDTLAGGLVSAGETLSVAMAREIREEAGLGPESYAMGKPVNIGRMNRELPEGWLSEEVMAFPVLLSHGANPHPLDGEAERIDLLAPAEIRRLLEDGAFVPGAALSLLSLCPELGL